MNNATQDQSSHAAPSSRREAGEEEPVNKSIKNGKADVPGILSRLDEIRYSPRAATIRAILKYAHEKDGALR